MFPVRKRKLYTPVTPPEYEEPEDNKFTVVQSEENAEIKKIPEKKNSVLQKLFDENFNFPPLSHVEKAENREWKKLKPILLKAPISNRHERVFHRLNTLETANSIANANIKDRELEIVKSHESLNTLDVITQKLVKERCKVEKAINPIDIQQEQQQQQPIEVSCEGLKSIFIEHDVMTTAKSATDASVKEEQGFILSHLKSNRNSDSGDDCEPTTNNQSVNKALITEDILNDWINSTSIPDNNPLDRGIFPQTPTLSRSSKRISKKAHLNTSHFLQ